MLVQKPNQHHGSSYGHPPSSQLTAHLPNSQRRPHVLSKPQASHQPSSPLRPHPTSSQQACH